MRLAGPLARLSMRFPAPARGERRARVGRVSQETLQAIQEVSRRQKLSRRKVTLGLDGHKFGSGKQTIPADYGMIYRRLPVIEL
jgi:hypothetical protein